MQAWVDRDDVVVDRLLHPEFTLRSIASDDLVDRATWRADAVGGRIRGTSFEYRDVTVVEAGDAAVVDAQLSFSGTIDGADWSATTHVTDVWTREDGSWRVLRRHASRAVGHGGKMQA